MVNNTPEADATVYLNDLPYQVPDATIRRFSASGQPAKIISGDFNLDTHPLVSIWSLSDNRGGIGIDRFDLSTDVGRCWYTTCNLRTKNHLTLGRLINATTDEPAAEIGAMVSSNVSGTEILYAAFGTDIYKLGTDEGWDDTTQNLTAAATDAKEGFVGSTQFVVFATGSSIEHSTDGTTFTANTNDPPKYIEFLDGLIWGIQDDGDTFWSNDITAAWKTGGKLLLPPGFIHGLFTARFNIGGAFVYQLCASTKVGIYKYNTAQNRWEESELARLPVHPDNGKAFCVWRGDIYFGQGLDVLRYTQSAATAVISSIGLVKDDGMPEGRLGTVTRLLPSFNELIAVIDSGDVGVQSDSLLTGDVGQIGGGADTPAWSNPTNAQLDDGAYATWVGDDATATSATLTGTAANVAGNDGDWTNESNVTADNDTYATGDATNTATDFLSTTNYDFATTPNIPATAIIRGFELAVRGKGTSSQTWHMDARLELAGVVIGVTQTDTSQAWTSSEQTFTIGSSTNLFGATPNVADVEATTFGVRFRVYDPAATSSDTLSVDFVKLTVHYSEQQNSDIILATMNGDGGGAVNTVPTTATVSGIQVDIEKSADSGGNNNAYQDVSVRLQKTDGGGAIGDNKAETTTNWPSSDTVIQYGGSGDLWGVTWSVSEVNATEFGVLVQIDGNNGNGSPQAKIDFIRITVYYTDRNATVITFDTFGWQVSAQGAADEGPIDAAIVSEENGNYRLFFAENQDVEFIDIPKAIDRPTFQSNDEFALTSTYESSWFDANAIHQDRLAVELHVDSDHPTSSETIQIEYATNYVESYTTLDTKTATGDTRYKLPTSASPIGIPFRAWKFRLTFKRGATKTNTPDMIRIALVYRRRNENLNGWSFTVKISDDEFNGIDAAEMVANLDSARVNETLVKFQPFDDDLGPYYVQVIGFQQLSGTAFDFTGTYQVTLAELVESS